MVERHLPLRLPVVVWLHGHECTGCSEAFIRSGAPMASDVVLNMIVKGFAAVLHELHGLPIGVQYAALATVVIIVIASLIAGCYVVSHF